MTDFSTSPGSSAAVERDLPTGAVARGSPPTPPQATDADPDTLADALRRQLQLYEQLNELAQRQTELIEQEAPDPLLALLAQRQRLIDELGALAATMEPMRRGWSTAAPTWPADRRQKINQLIDRIELLRAGILERDDRDRRRLSESRRVLHDELGRLSRVGQAIRAYGRGGASKPPPGSVGSDNRFTDRQG